MLVSFLITDQWQDDGKQRRIDPKRPGKPRYLLEDVEVPKEPQIGSLVCLIRDDGKGMYFRVNQVILYPHKPTPLTMARTDDWGNFVQVNLKYGSAKDDDIYHICIPENPYTPGKGVWKKLPSVERSAEESATKAAT